MANRKATNSIFINKYRPNSEGLCSVSIRITFDRKKKYYPTPVNLSAEDFEKVQGAKPRKDFKEIALKLQAYENKAAEIIDKLPFFHLESFRKAIPR